LKVVSSINIKTALGLFTLTTCCKIVHQSWACYVELINDIFLQLGEVNLRVLSLDTVLELRVQKTGVQAKLRVFFDQSRNFLLLEFLFRLKLDQFILEHILQ
jgi:hypothetical protein